MLSKKDYEMIAKVINRRLSAKEDGLSIANFSKQYTQGRRDGIASLALDIGYELQNANPRFNIDKWVTATTKRETN